MTELIHFHACIGKIYFILQLFNLIDIDFHYFTQKKARKAEAYSEPCQTSKMEHIAKKLHHIFFIGS